MNLKKQHKSHPSTHKSNDTFVRPSSTQATRMNKENPDKKVTNSGFDSGVKSDFFGEPAFIQAKAKNDSPSTIQSSNTEGNSQTKNKTGMPSSLKSGLENLSGEDLSGVRVHRNSPKPDKIGAHAYAQGENIYLGQGQEKHLPHEGWHVVQQKQGRVQPTIQQKNKLINNDASLEKEADIMGEKAVQMKSKDAPIQAKNNRNATRNGVIQRAMKYEWQTKNSNKMYRDTGSKVQELPRKFGPEDFVTKTKSGARLETETGGKLEFETPWERTWLKLAMQVSEAQQMVRNINTVKEEKASDGLSYRKFPASHLGLEHLAPGQGFKTTGSRWDRSQNTGKRVVTKSVENVRSSPEYKKSDPEFNKIGELKQGNKLKVKEESSDGKWLKFKSSSINGWIWKGSTKLETKRYESELNSDKVNIDTELQDHEYLLIKVGDTSWKADFQVSESFELGQFDSYLKDNHPAAEPTVKLKTDSLMALASAKGGSKELQNFLMMVVYFIHRARSVNLERPGKTPYYAKAAFKLMNRTNFGSIYKSSNLTDTDRAIFKTLVNGTTEGILPTMLLDRSSEVFVKGQGSKGINPTVYKWLTSIVNGSDYLSGPTGRVSGAMGKFDINAEQGKNDNLVRYENRGAENRTQPVDNWLEWTTEHYLRAMKNRPRSFGKGETGLKLW